MKKTVNEPSASSFHCLNPLYCSCSFTQHSSIKEQLYLLVQFDFHLHVLHFNCTPQTLPMWTPTQYSTSFSADRNNSLSFLSGTGSSIPLDTSCEFVSDEFPALQFSFPECSKDLEWLNNNLTTTTSLPSFSANNEPYNRMDEQLGSTENGGGGGDDLSRNQFQVVEFGDNYGIISTHHVVKKQKSRRQSLGKRRTAHQIGIKDLELHFGKTRAEAAKILGVSVPTLKRIRKKYGIPSWPLNKKKNGDLSAEIIDEGLLSQITTTTTTSSSYLVDAPVSAMQPEPETEIQPSPVKLSTVIAKVQYRDDFVKFEISSASKLADLEDEISKRLKLRDGSFDIKYFDDEGDWVLIRKDEDFWLCMRTLETATIKMLVLPCSD